VRVKALRVRWSAARPKSISAALTQPEPLRGRPRAPAARESHLATLRVNSGASCEASTGCARAINCELSTHGIARRHVFATSRCSRPLLPPARPIRIRARRASPSSSPQARARDSNSHSMLARDTFNALRRRMQLSV
jgi:hypothetical protein